MQNITLFTLLFIANINFLFAQGENNNWYINGTKLFNLNNNPPTIDSFNSLWLNQGYNVSVSNENGDLLFVSVGDEALNIDGEVMPNGGDLDNAFSSSFWPISFSFQPISVIQSLSSENQYYLFVLSDGYDILENNNDYGPGTLQYSIIDMSLDEGRGDILLEQKNIFLADNLTGAMTTVKGECGSVWLLTHEYESNRFIVFKITETGISEPVISEVGLPALNDLTSGERRININGVFASSDGTKIIFFLEDDVQLFDFDKANGFLSNPIDLPINASAMAGTFSPLGDYFYTSEAGGNENTLIYRFDVGNDNPSIIQNSKTVIDSLNNDSSLSILQYAPNGSIYGTLGRGFYEIKNPDDSNLNNINIDTINTSNMEGGFMYNLPNLIIKPCLNVATEDFGEMEQDLDVEFFPNPFSNQLRISLNGNFSEKTKFLLYDTVGKLVFYKYLNESLIQHQVFIPNNMKSGIYFYQVQNSKGIMSGKLLKK